MKVESNQQRAESLLKAYDRSMENLGDLDRSLLGDVMADLMHFCHVNHIDIERVVKMADTHYREEILEENQNNKRKESKP